MLHILAHPHQLPREPELSLDGSKHGDARSAMAFAVEVKGEEARKVLDCAEELVATDWELVSIA